MREYSTVVEVSDESDASEGRVLQISGTFVWTNLYLNHTARRDKETDKDCSIEFMDSIPSFNYSSTSGQNLLLAVPSRGLSRLHKN